MPLDREQFEAQSMEHLDTLYRIAKRLTRSSERAEDLVQDTILRAFRFRESYVPKEYGIRPWLIRIMHNLHYSQTGRAQRQPHLVDDEQLEAAAITNDPLPFNPRDFDGMDERLARAVHALQPEYQSVMLMWAVEEMSYKEIAEALEVPLGTVMSRLHRARQHLSEQLAAFRKELGLDRE